MTDMDDKLKRMSFKDFTVVDYMPGQGEYINYQAQKRHRGTVGEEVEQIDEAMQYLSKDELPAKVQRVVTNLFKIAKKEKKSIQRLSVYLVNKKYAIDVELGNKLNDDEDFVGKLMSVASFRDKFVSVDVSSSVSPAPNVTIKESVEQTDKAKLAEAMTVAQRIKAKQRMKKMSKRIQMAKKRSMKRAPSTEKLKLRARRQAKGAMIKKWMKGKSKSDMSFSQRQNIEKRLKSASGRIDTMSKKLLPSVRQIDRDRRSNVNQKSEEK